MAANSILIALSESFSPFRKEIIGFNLPISKLSIVYLRLLSAFKSKKILNKFSSTLDKTLPKFIKRDSAIVKELNLIKFPTLHLFYTDHTLL